MGEKTQEQNPSPKKFEVGLKYWLQGENNFTLGPGDVKLIRALLQHGNLTKASLACHYSYKYGWKKLKTLTQTTGLPVVETSKGGYGGGGAVEVTPWGKYLVEMFEGLEKNVGEFQAKQNAFLLRHPYKPAGS